MKHAKLSPSSAHRWMQCPASVALESDFPNTSSAFADEGTAAHELAAMCLQEAKPAEYYRGHEIAVGDTTYTVDDEMIENVQRYLDIVSDLRGEDGVLSVEVRMFIGDLTGEDNAFGTSDAVICRDGELVVADLKYGKGVKVDADGNHQLKIYALAAAKRFGIIHPFSSVRLAIIQPRIGHVSECQLSMAELETFADEVHSSAEVAKACHNWYQDKHSVPVRYFTPGEKQCRFCKAKGACQALAEHNLRNVLSNFKSVEEVDSDDLREIEPLNADQLGALLSHAETIEGWVKALREHCSAELNAGRNVTGFKLVAGRKGNRKWNDESTAADELGVLLSSEDIYEHKLISPATAEKMLKKHNMGADAISGLVHQPEGKPVVVPESDKRQPISTLSEFN